MSKGYTCRLQDYVEQLIEETGIDFTELPSFRSWADGKGGFEYDYDEDEAYPVRLSEFKDRLARRGWYYTLCLRTRGWKKWQKATRNKKLYNRINALILRLMEEYQ